MKASLFPATSPSKSSFARENLWKIERPMGKESTKDVARSSDLVEAGQDLASVS